MKTFTLTLGALLVVVQIILSRFFTITLPTAKVGFAFLALFISGYKLGHWTIAVAVVADVVGALVFTGQIFYPPITCTAALIGYLYGQYFYNKTEYDFWELFVAILAINLISFSLNTVWLSHLYNKAMILLVPIRVFAMLAQISIQYTTTLLFYKRKDLLTKFKKLP